MRVSLTPNAEHILRDALAQHPGQSAENLVEQALRQQFGPTLADASILERLRGIPNLRVPDHWPPCYPPVEPLPYDGDELPSEQLIRKRR